MTPVAATTATTIAAAGGAARQSACPHPQAGGSGRNAAPNDRLRANLTGPSSAPRILLPGKDPGTYEEDGEGVGGSVT